MKQPPLFESIQDLVLHRPPMLLLRSVESWDTTSLVAMVDTQDSLLFQDENGKIPAWVGIEYMAQAIGALAGIIAKLESRPVCLGFLLGTRRYESTVTHFDAYQELRVCVKQLLHDETNLVLFGCEILSNDNSIASAELKAIQPDNIDEVMNQLTRMNYLPTTLNN